MSNRIWNIYGVPLSKRKYEMKHPTSSKKFTCAVLTPSKGYSKEFASKNYSIFVSKFIFFLMMKIPCRFHEREYYVGLLFFNLLNPLIGETRVKSLS